MISKELQIDVTRAETEGPVSLAWRVMLFCDVLRFYASERGLFADNIGKVHKVDLNFIAHELGFRNSDEVLSRAVTLDKSSEDAHLSMLD